VHAAERNMSLSRYIGEVLRAQLKNSDEYERAMRGWLSAKPFPLKGPAERYPKRARNSTSAARARSDDPAPRLRRRQRVRL
jgi:hypothetical protein